MARVLVVDDVRSNVDLLALHLRKAGHEVFAAENGQEALDIAAEKVPDLILMDVQMPIMDGIEACRRLQAEEKLRSIPVIMVSGNSDREDVIRALDVGAHDYIIKPVHWRTAAARIRSALRIKEAHDFICNMNQQLDTAKRTAEGVLDELREAKDYIDNVIGSMIDMLVVVSPNGMIRTVNEAACDALGYPAKELIGQPASLIFSKEEDVDDDDDENTLQSIVPREALPFRRAIFRQLVTHGTIRNIEKALCAKNGRTIPVLVSSSVMRDKGGTIQGVVCVAQDISERRRADAALRESEERFKSICASAQDAIIMMDADGHISYWNDAATAIFGYARDEIIGKLLHSVGLIVPERFHEAHCRAWPRFQECGEGAAVGKTIEVIGLKKNGAEFPAEFSLSAVKIKHRWHAIGMLRDITERKSAEAELRKLSVAVEQSPASIIVTDRQGTIEYVNPKFTEVTGYTAAEAIGQKPLILKSGQWPKEAYKRLWDKILAGETWTGEFENKKKNGETYWEAASICPIRDGEGVITHFLAVKQDITENKKAEQALAAANLELRQEQKQLKRTHTQLLHAQKMESIGQLAAGIAHEINTPIQFVGDNTRFQKDSFADLSSLLEKYERLRKAALNGSVTPELFAEVDAAIEEADLKYLQEEIPKAIEQSLEGVERVAKIVRSMKEFSHPGGNEKQPADLNKAIESTITVSRNEWKYVAEMVMKLDPALPPVPCLLGDFNQVVLNMIVNAAHAITDVVGKDSGEKGTITVSTRQEGEWAVIRIGDTGGGMPAEVRAKVFDPFFTTKEVGKGTGQGLAIARSVVVQKHGGTIDVESEVGRGTVFIIRLPIDQKPSEPMETRKHEAAHPVC